MHSFKGELAVVTGAASGIGKALSIALAQQGSRLALIDIDAAALQETREELEGKTEVLAIEADVSNGEQVDKAAVQITNELGPVGVLCNNAGVGVAGSAIDTPDSVWQWTFGVNVFGVVNCTRAFVPSMIERNHGHVMNVASVAGLLAPAGMASYVASKHAIVGYTESLLHELQARDSDVAVSVACPGMVDTAISDSERNWPKHHGHLPAIFQSRFARVVKLKHRRALSKSMSPQTAAKAILDGMRHKHFWIFTDDQYKNEIKAHADLSKTPAMPKYL